MSVRQAKATRRPDESSRPSAVAARVGGTVERELLVVAVVAMVAALPAF
jgi:hypothetical protein